MNKDELKALLVKRDNDILALNSIVAQKNEEIKQNDSKQELAGLRAAYQDLAGKHNVLISDIKNQLQLFTSGTELMSSNINKAIQSLGPVRPQAQPPRQ